MESPEEPHVLLGELVSLLNLQPGDAEHVYGEVRGSPVTMTFIAAEPLSLLLSFKIVASHPAIMPLLEDVRRLVDDGRAKVSLEGGFAWLSLDDLSGESSGSIQALVENFADGLSAAHLAVAPGCVSCGCRDDVQVLFLEERCSRLCPRCVAAIFQEREQTEQDLNRPSVVHALGLPLATLYVAGGWLIFWLLVDVLLDWLNTQTVELNEMVTLLLAGLFFVIAFGLGYPIGTFLRRSGIARRWPLAVTLPTVILACVVGETLYIAAVIFWQAGVFDIAWAAQCFLPFIRQYHHTWIASKVVTVGAIGLGCYIAAKARREVALRL